MHALPLTMVVRSDYMSYYILSGSSNQSVHFLLTSLINKVFAPTELCHSVWVFFFFFWHQMILLIDYWYYWFTPTVLMKQNCVQWPTCALKRTTYCSDSGVSFFGIKTKIFTLIVESVSIITLHWNKNVEYIHQAIPPQIWWVQFERISGLTILRLEYFIYSILVSTFPFESIGMASPKLLFLPYT